MGTVAGNNEQSESYRYNFIEDLSKHNISKIGFFVKSSDGMQWYCGIRLYDDNGVQIVQQIWNGGGQHWYDQEFKKGQYLIGFYGKVHKYFYTPFSWTWVDQSQNPLMW